VKVLITGADGFIGSHLTDTLVRQGKDVRAFTFYNSMGSNGWLDVLAPDVRREIEFFPGDVRDLNRINSAVEGCTAVFHLAALIAIPYSYHAVDSYISTNINGTSNVMRASLNHGVERVIHTSTSEVYGTARYIPIDESHPLQGQSPYSATKIAADKLVESFHNSFSLPVTTVRPFNTYGPRQSNRAVIPTIITQLARGQHEVKLGSIAPTRDFTFVSDTVRGFIAALDSQNAIGKTFNLGIGFEVSILQTLEMIAEILGADFQIISDQDRVRPEGSEVDRLLSDNSLAKSILGWQPEYEGIEGFAQGLKQTIDWFINPDNLSRYPSDVYSI
jgi:NAD dependent epimerase/dehydratase